MLILHPSSLSILSAFLCASVSLAKRVVYTLPREAGTDRREPAVTQVGAVQDFLYQVDRDVVVLVRRLETDPGIMGLEDAQPPGQGDLLVQDLLDLCQYGTDISDGLRRCKFAPEHDKARLVGRTAKV